MARRRAQGSRRRADCAYGSAYKACPLKPIAQAHVDPPYLIQEFETTTPNGRKLPGIEYVTWNEDTQTLRSHLMADDGSNFSYTYQVDDDGTCWTWFGDKGKNFSRAG
jgi:hypothetical protein